jgi:site-specific DNA-methyltransferase (adenine-specific)
MGVNIEVIHGDCLAEIPKLRERGIIIDAVCCDPPYHLLPTQKRFGALNAAPAKHGRDGAMARLSSGFMNSQWDGGDIAFRPETWSEIASIMRPGAFLAAFGGCRTHHRLTCAIEDAGFVIQDCIMFLFGTGFPKRRDMLKPAYEPIVLAYKPGGKRSMQIDECRIETAAPVSRGTTHTRAAPANGDTRNNGKGSGAWEQGRAFTVSDDPMLGRWPANVCHDGSEEVLAAFPQTTASPNHPVRQGGTRGFDVGSDGEKRDGFGVGYGDDGSAARFFFSGTPGSDQRRFHFSSKAQKEDRWGSRHPTIKPVELMKWLVALVCPKDGLLLDPFAGSGTTGVAALATGRDCILIEREASYVADIRERMAHYEGSGRHSLASKARRQQDKPLGGLFEQPYDEVADARGSYDEAVRVIGESVKAGAPVPDFFLSDQNKL